jgi:mannose-6-phosphate isomerase
MQCVDFMDRTAPRISGVSDSTEHSRKFPIINKCPYFRVDDLRLVDTWRDNTHSTNSFHLLTAINNPVKIGRDEQFTEVKPGVTCLVPACFGSYSIRLETDQETTVVKTTL